VSEKDSYGPDNPGNGGENQPDKGKIQRKEAIEEYRLVPVEETVYHSSDDEELIDILGMLKDLWLQKRVILTVASLVFLFGLFMYLGSERYYYSEAQLMPENTSGESRLGQLFQQYGSFFGIQRNTEQSDIQVSMYPHIVESLPFQIELMQHEVNFSSLDQSITIFDYFTEYYEPPIAERMPEIVWAYTIELPFTLWRHIRSIGSGPRSERPPVDFSELHEFDAPKELDSRVRSVATKVSSLITITREPQTGFVSIGVSLPDPVASTEMVTLVRNLLQQYVVDYRTEKAMQNLEFIEERYEEAKANFQAQQDTLAAFQDRNVNLTQQSYQVQEERLRSEYELALSLYTTLARRLQEAEIQVQEETPVFRVHEPAVIPSRPSTPSAARILGGSIFVGFFFGVAAVYLRRGYHRFRTDFKNKDPKPYLA
jgi:hypothetical protein